MIQRQIEEVMLSNARPFLAFIGSLFLFIATLNLLSIFPGYRSPTGSLSTTSALAVCVFVVVPIYGIRAREWDSISDSIYNLPSSCCRSTFSASCLAPWRWPCVSSATS